MARLHTGSIEFEVSAYLPEAVLDDIEHASKLPLSSESREWLRRIYFAWCERQEMARPELADVRRIIAKLMALAIPSKREKFADQMSELALANEREQPAEFYVHDRLMALFDVSIAVDWRDDIRSGRLDLSRVREVLKGLEFALGEDFRWIQGGKRDHDLGWVLEALGDLPNCIGHKVSYSTIYDRYGEERRYGAFIRFCEAFISHLPHIPDVKRPSVSRLISENFAKLDAVRRRRDQKNSCP